MWRIGHALDMRSRVHPRYKTKYRVSSWADSSSDYKSDDEGRVNAYIREIVAADPEIEWFHDLSRAYDGDESIFIEDGHVSENGSALMAERVAEIAAPHRALCRSSKFFGQGPVLAKRPFWVAA